MVNADRTYVICHMMSTIEGKIDSGVKGKDILGEYYSVYSQLEHELQPQAWMCGRVTSEMFAEAVATPLPPLDINISQSDFKSSFNAGKFMIAIDTKGLLRWKTDVLTFEDKSVHQLMIIVTKITPKEYLSYLQKKNISYVFAGEDRVDFKLLFEKLKQEYQIDTLALEGGGLLNGSVMAAELVDEISLLVTPLVLNRTDAPSVFERKADDEVNTRKYKLFSVKQMENNSVWLRYKKD